MDCRDYIYNFYVDANGKKMKATGKIFGTPHQEQEVSFEFEYYPIRKWFSEERSTFFVNYLKLSETLNFQPTDIKTDLELAIAQALGEDEIDIRIECEIKYKVVPVIVLPVENIEYKNMMFI